MCTLCSSDPEEKKAAEWYHRDVAARLRSLAKSYDMMASGTIKPHTKDMEGVTLGAKSLIRELVEYI